jgi:membrane associated rhomboid family serine protease
MRIQYNSPVILTFTLLSAAVLFLTQFLGLSFLEPWFRVCPDVSMANPLSWPRLLTHVIGHANTAHLVGNFTLILLIGPILEEKYGSKDILIMVLVTALLTGILQVTLFHNECLLGASGIVFLLIILSSFTNFQSGKIPLTFILVVVLFLGKEILGAFGEDQVSQFAHIIGGICGAIFGFVLESGQRKKKK